MLDRLIGLTDDLRKHRHALHEAGDHDAAEAWDDTYKALRSAEANAPYTEDRP